MRQFALDLETLRALLAAICLHALMSSRIAAGKPDVDQCLAAVDWADDLLLAMTLKPLPEQLRRRA